jgi:hypothetical protein
MKRYFFIIVLPVSILLLLLNACVSKEPVSEPTIVKEKAPEVETTVETPVQVEEKDWEIPAEDQTADTAASDGSYQMGAEEYETTKKDLSELVQELNTIISQQNYERWLNYLTREYIEYYSDPKILQEYSSSPTLSKYNIKLRSLKDYFNYVVVASRRDVRIDDISAISENKVKAYMIVNEEPIVVYTLEKIDKRWKITR